jgi:hypothetical protein
MQTLNLLVKNEDEVEDTKLFEAKQCKPFKNI